MVEDVLRRLSVIYIYIYIYILLMKFNCQIYFSIELKINFWVYDSYMKLRDFISLSLTIPTHLYAFHEI